MTDWMLDTFCASSLLIIAVLLLRRPVAHFFGASIAYALWVIPAARLFMPILYKEVEAVPASLPLNAQAMLPINNPMDNNINLAATADNNILSIPQINWTMSAMILWAGIAAAIFIIQTARYIAMRDETIANAKAIDQHQNVTIIESDMVSGPLAFGIFKKYIAVPLDFEKTFPIEEREMALTHEMAHHKSGDLIANLFAFTFLCLTWFSPLSWFAWNKFRIDQESACDARVLKGADKQCAHNYGRALVRSASNEAPIFATALNSPKTILTRLRRIKLPERSNKRQLFGRMSIFAAVATVLPLTATTIPVAAQEESLAPKEATAKKIQKVDPNIVLQDTDKTITEKGDNKKTVSLVKFPSDSDQKSRKIIVSDDSSIGVKTQEIEKDGRNFIISSNNELSEENTNQLIADAEKSLKKVKVRGKVKFPDSTRFIIRSDDKGEIRTFNIVGDEKAKIGKVIFNTEKDIIKAEGRVEIKADSFTFKPNHQPTHINCEDDIKDNKKKLCKGEIKFLVSQSLQDIQAVRADIQKTLHKKLKNSKITKKERKKIIKEFEKEMKELQRSLDTLNI